MRHWILTFLAAGCLFACLAVASPKPASADEYWDGYWSWYDGTYSPYYTRRYYAAPYSSGYPYAGAYYGPSYGVYPGDPYIYGRSRYYGGDYYGTPNFGYRDFPSGAGQVRVGPMRFGWR